MLWNSDDVESALILAIQAHGGQVDKGGSPYILHVLRVGAAQWRNGPDYVIVGLLHDVVEDTNTTLSQLRSYGLSDEILSALDAITHRKGEPYEDYLGRVKKNPIALAVKREDLGDNLERLDSVESLEERERLRCKCKRAVGILGGGK